MTRDNLIEALKKKGIIHNLNAIMTEVDKYSESLTAAKLPVSRRLPRIKCKNIVTGKNVWAYHVEDCGAAHNKSNTLCIGCVGVDLIPVSNGG